jgi:transposase InsO family protein
MPWSDVSVMELREQVVQRVLSGGAGVSRVAREFAVSRACVYKWLRRFADEGAGGLQDRSRRPHHSPHRTAGEIEAEVCKMRAHHSTWSGDKVHRKLAERGCPGLPSARTVQRILTRKGQVQERPPPAEPQRFEREAPNELWQIDCKKTYYLQKQPQLVKAVPLSILDDCSRFNLALSVHEGRALEVIWPVLWDVMGTWGLPQAILTDNDGVFRGRRGGVSAWTARLWRLGINHLSGRCYHPQTQGKVERFHRTLQEDALTNEVFESLEHLQAHLDAFRHEYNYEHPHAALDLDVPAQHYTASPRKRPAQLPQVEYPSDADLRRVHQNGAISVRGCRINVGDGLRGEWVQLRETDETLVIEYAGFVARRVAWTQLQSGKWL